VSRRALACLVVVACGSKPPPASPPPPDNHTDTRNPLERRRDAACELVARRVTACAMEDSKRDLDAGKVTKEQFDKDTAASVLAKNAAEYADKCKAHGDYSSRQVRVLEKCPEYETTCEPFLKCLENIQPQNK
jgi:hypothetical protein